MSNNYDNDYCKECGTPLLYPDRPCPKCNTSQDAYGTTKLSDKSLLDYYSGLTFNFSFNKAYTDLTADKKYIWELLSLVLVFFVIDIMGILFKSKGTSSIGSILVSGYMCLMANNILHSREPVLTNIFATKEKGRNIFWVGFKQNMAQLAYFIILFIAGFFIVQFLSGNYGIKLLEGSIIAAFILLPLIVFSLFASFILFIENLSFKESFNILKAAKSFKYAWKGYLLSGALTILNLVGVSIIVTTLGKVFSNVIISQVLNLFMYSCIIICCYFTSHFITQSYKYALLKMSE